MGSFFFLFVGSCTGGVPVQVRDIPTAVVSYEEVDVSALDSAEESAKSCPWLLGWGVQTPHQGSGRVGF